MNAMIDCGYSESEVLSQKPFPVGTNNELSDKKNFKTFSKFS